MLQQPPLPCHKSAHFHTLDAHTHTQSSVRAHLAALSEYQIHCIKDVERHELVVRRHGRISDFLQCAAVLQASQLSLDKILEVGMKWSRRHR